MLATLQSLKADEMFFFIDELGPLQVKRYGGRCYTPKKKTPTHPQSQRSKGSIILHAALSATTNQVTWLYGDAKDTAAMIDLVELLFNQYHDKSRLYITWDAASWHSSNQLMEWVDELNAGNCAHGNGPIIEFVPLPTSSQFLNVIETVFSTMKKAVIHDSDYQSEEEMKTAISRHFRERNEFFKHNPRRAGKKIWEIDFFKDFNNMRWRVIIANGEHKTDLFWSTPRSFSDRPPTRFTARRCSLSMVKITRSLMGFCGIYSWPGER